MKKFVLLPLFFVLCLPAFIVPQQSDLNRLVGLKGMDAPGFTAIGMDDEEYDLKSLQGKIVVLNLWAIFCLPCHEEIPKLNQIVKKYKDKNVVFLAPAPDDKIALGKFLKEIPFDYAVLPRAYKLLGAYLPKDPENPAAFNFVYPTHVLIDEKGKVAEYFWGYDETTVSKLDEGIGRLVLADENSGR
ncbi:MAG: TlpA disulfide reductase family protein [Pyrinomonadaceae bacterium]